MLTPVAKHPLQSLTITSAAGSFLVALLSMFGVDIDIEMANQIVVNINAIVGAVLALVTIWGRWRASRTIRLNPD